MIMTIRIIQNGLGKMGSAAYKRFKTSSDIEVVAIADPAARYYDINFGETAVFDDIIDYRVTEMSNEMEREPGYVLVDFSTPDAALTAARYVAERGGKIVIGTTPLPKEVEEQIAALGDHTAVMMASNYSPDVHRFFYMMKRFCDFSDPDECVSVYERHRAEKPSVSGTAKDIAKILGQGMRKAGYIVRGKDEAYDCDGNKVGMPAMKPDELRRYVQVSYERFADEPGLHVVRIGDENDYMRFEVRATRASYAAGVEKAVRYIDTVDKGLHDFSRDVLGMTE